MCPASNIRRIYAKIVQTSGNKKESAKRFAISCPSTVHPHKKPTNQSCDRQTSEIVTRHHTNLSPLHLPTYHPNSDKLPYRTHCNITFINSVKNHENAQHSIPCKRPHSDTSRRRKKRPYHPFLHNIPWNDDNRPCCRRSMGCCRSSKACFQRIFSQLCNICLTFIHICSTS